MTRPITVRANIRLWQAVDLDASVVLGTRHGASWLSVSHEQSRSGFDIVCDDPAAARVLADALTWAADQLERARAAEPGDRREARRTAERTFRPEGDAS